MEKETNNLLSIKLAEYNIPTFPKQYSYAMSYIPFQQFEMIYDEKTAFRKGTLFEQLYKPFIGCGRPIS